MCISNNQPAVADELVFEPRFESQGIRKCQSNSISLLLILVPIFPRVQTLYV